jgi:signal transduction histidine kinase
MTRRSLSEGNRLQRAYFAWAAPRYARMPADVREQVEATDRFLYSRSGLSVWAGMGVATAAIVLVLRLSGVSWLLATAAGAVIGVSLPLLGLTVWLMPNVFARGAQIRKPLLMTTLGALCGMGFGFVVGHVEKHGQLDLALLASEVGRKAGVALPILAMAVAALFGLSWAAARLRRQGLERALERAQMQQERDSAAREAAEARLKLLQAQIQPHFIFNTLAALQHWVDTGDGRAPPLLRTLTAFLRGSTELLGQEQVPLGQEAAMADHYLAIMQARLGERLRFVVDIAPALADVPVPPGLLLTLVENAVEHGIAPLPGGGEVRVRARTADTGWRLEVADNGAGLAADWREGLGLSNCRQRLAHAYGSNARFTIEACHPGTVACITTRVSA